MELCMSPLAEPEVRVQILSFDLQDHPLFPRSVLLQ